MAAVDVENVGQVLRILMCLAPVEAAGLAAQSVHAVPEVAAAAPQPPNLLPSLRGQVTYE